MNIKRGWTVDEYIQAGKKLKEARKLMMEVFIMRNSFPNASIATKSIGQAEKHIGIARSRLDNEMSREHPREFATSVFYGELTE